MRKSIVYAFILILTPAVHSCTKRISEKYAGRTLHPLELEYAMENPQALDKDRLRENIDYLVRNFLDTLDFKIYFRQERHAKFLAGQFGKFYKSQDYQPAWTTLETPLRAAGTLMQRLQMAHREGLEPEAYTPGAIMDLIEKTYPGNSGAVNLKDMIELDFLLTSRYLLYGYHLNAGRIDPEEVFENWYFKPGEVDLAANLAWALQNDLEAALDKLEPDRWEYRQLKEYYNQFLEKLRESEENIRLSHSLAGAGTGAKHHEIQAVKKALKQTGDLPLREPEDTVFDEALEKALMHFQRRYGLESTGKLDQSTIFQINVPIEHRLRVIRVNLERLKWFPRFDKTRIVVNVPEFRMRLYEDGNEKIGMRAIVGEELNPTPVFSDNLEYIVFNPTWTVPTSIAVKEFLPRLKEDPGFMAEDRYLLYDGWHDDAQLLDPDKVKWAKVDEEDFPYKIVQEPGDFNPLGKVKFMFPNNHSIYLHGTPATHLFDKEELGFSHGCVRLEKPFDLVDYLLENYSDWDKEDYLDALKKDEPVEVYLTEKLPVYMVYETAWVDEEGALNFRDDYYGIDSAHWRALGVQGRLLM